VPALRGALKRLLDEGLRTRLGETGRERVETHFQVTAMTDRILEIYDEISR
jgi:glycosyltransferase involved in cell wall biosynthesis